MTYEFHFNKAVIYFFNTMTTIMGRSGFQQHIFLLNVLNIKELFLTCTPKHWSRVYINWMSQLTEKEAWSYMLKLFPFCQKTLEQLKLLVKYYQRDLLHINYTQSHYFWQSHYNSILQRGNIIPSVLKCEHASESPEGLNKIQIAGSHPQNF